MSSEEGHHKSTEHTEDMAEGEFCSPPYIYRQQHPSASIPLSFFLSHSLSYSFLITFFSQRPPPPLASSSPTMRSPIIAFSIAAAVAVSPALVAGAPQLPPPPGPLSKSPSLPPPANNLPLVDPGVASQATGSKDRSREAAHHRRAFGTRREHTSKTHKHQNYARQFDSQTAGGNAYSGSSSNVDGGDVFNVAETPDGVITNNAGSSEYSISRTFCVRSYATPL